MLIGEVIDRVKAYCEGTLDGRPIDDATTRDKVLWGATDVECTGIVTTCFASADVIREAAARGANLVICHEALFWNHGDHTDWLRDDAVFQAKRDLLDAKGVCVWRCHDYIHSGIPTGGGYVDGIFWGLAHKLSWEGCLARPIGDISMAVPAEFNISRTSARGLARHLISKLGLNGTRVIGDPSADVQRVAFPMHAIGEFDNAIIGETSSEGIDCLVAMEVTDFTASEYVRDSSQVGRPRAIIALGHFNVEEPGMELMASWLPDALGDGPTATFIPSGDPFNYVLPE